MTSPVKSFPVPRPATVSVVRTLRRVLSDSVNLDQNLTVTWPQNRDDVDSKRLVFLDDDSELSGGYCGRHQAQALRGGVVSALSRWGKAYYSRLIPYRY